AIKLYWVLMDPHLTHGCETSWDTSLSVLECLLKVEVVYLRRAIGLHSRSPTVVICIETAVTPLRFRRAILGLSYLQYLVGLPEGTITRAAL
ncbi:hypothetical protein BKA70DRAFT_1034611, partial [Coprinopsis sp. MPI-PUGE-AT-0042]